MSASIWQPGLSVSTGNYELNVLDPEFGVTGDGVTDDTAGIQLCLDTAALRGARRVIFPPVSVAYYGGDIDVPANITLDGLFAAKLKLKPHTGAIGSEYHGFFRAVAKNHITVVGFTIDGNSSAQTPEPGQEDRYAALYFVNCSYLNITEIKCTSAAYGNANIRVRQGTAVKIRECNVIDNGIYFNAFDTACYSLEISNNSTSNCGIAINDDTLTQYLFGLNCCNNLIRASNTLDNYGLGIRASEGVISSNVIIGGYFGMTISSGGATFQQHGMVISGNIIIADSGSLNPYGIEHYANEITITGNILYNCGIVSSASSGRNIVVSGNVLLATLATLASDTAISLSAGQFNRVTIDDNQIYGWGSGISVAYAQTALHVCDNQFKLNGYAGSAGIVLSNTTASSKTLTGAIICDNITEDAPLGWLHVKGNGANNMTVSKLRAFHNACAGTTTGLSLGTAGVLDSTCTHSFNHLTYPTFQNVPTSAPSESGAIWRDAAASNVLKMVP